MAEWVHRPQTAFTPVNHHVPTTQCVNPLKTLRSRGIDSDAIYDMPEDKVLTLTVTKSKRRGSRGPVGWADAAIAENTQMAHSARPSLKRRKHATAEELVSRSSATVDSSDDVEFLFVEDTLGQVFQGDTTCLDITSMNAPKPQARGRAKSKAVSKNKKNMPFKELTVTKPTGTRAEEVSVCSVRSPIVSTYHGWTTTEEVVKAAPKTTHITKTTLDKLAAFRYKSAGKEVDVLTSKTTFLSAMQRLNPDLPRDKSEVSEESQIPPIHSPSWYDSSVATQETALLYSDTCHGQTYHQNECHIPDANGLLGPNMNESFFTHACWNPEDDQEQCNTNPLDCNSPEVSSIVEPPSCIRGSPSVPGIERGSVISPIPFPQNTDRGNDQQLSEFNPRSGHLFMHRDVSGPDPLDLAVVKPGKQKLTYLAYNSDDNLSPQDFSGTCFEEVPVTYSVSHDVLCRIERPASLSASEGVYCKTPTDCRAVPEINQCPRVQAPRIGTYADKSVLESKDRDEFNEGLDDSDLLEIVSRTYDIFDNSTRSGTSKEVDLRLPDIGNTDPVDEYPMDGSDEEEMLKFATLNLEVTEKFQPSQSHSFAFPDQSSEVYDSTLQFSPPKSQASMTSPQYVATQRLPCHADHDSAYASPNHCLGGSTSPEVGIDEWSFLNGTQSNQDWSDRITTAVENCRFNQAESRVPSSPNTITKEPCHQAVEEMHADSNSVIDSPTDPLDGDHEFAPLKRFTRPEFPSLLRDRSPVIGLSAQAFLRTCFRIAEMYKEGKRCNSFGQDAVIELFARVTFSSREPGTMKQHFQFADLFDDHPPFPQGVLMNYKMSDLADSESGMLIGKCRQMVRCLGRLKRDVKNDTGWLLHILTIRETDWEEVRYTKRVICADAMKAEGVAF